MLLFTQANACTAFSGTTFCTVLDLDMYTYIPVQTGGLQKIADDISRAVKTNCDKPAIVMSHSYGANVMATLFQKPEFTDWR